MNKGGYNQYGYGGIPMEQSLLPDQCHGMRHFLRGLVTAANKAGITITVTGITEYIDTYRRIYGPANKIVSGRGRLPADRKKKMFPHLGIGLVKVTVTGTICDYILDQGWNYVSFSVTPETITLTFYTDRPKEKHYVLTKSYYSTSNGKPHALVIGSSTIITELHNAGYKTGQAFIPKFEGNKAICTKAEEVIK